MSILHLPTRRYLSLAAAIAFSAGRSHAGIIWNEQFDGDLSDDRFAPTTLQVAAGDNELLGILAGATGGPEGGIDRDYYTFTIPDGHALTAIVLTAYLSPDFTAFLGVQPGAVFPDDPNTVIPSDLLGWVHFGPIDVGTDLLPEMGFHGQGFTPPLPAGTYSFWTQQTDDYTDYAMIFVIEEVPAPTSCLIAGALGTMIGVRRARR